MIGDSNLLNNSKWKPNTELCNGNLGDTNMGEKNPKP